MKNNESKSESFKIREMKDSGSDMSPISNQPISRRKGRRLKGLFTFILLVAVAALSYGYYIKDAELKAIQNPEVKAAMEQKEIEKIVAQVSKIMILPKDEAPQVLTINDADAAIKQQPAFSGSLNGDKVLIYQKSAKAIVYSPSRNVIVNVLPVTIENNTQANTTSTNTASTAKKSASTSTADTKSDN